MLLIRRGRAVRTCFLGAVLSLTGLITMAAEPEAVKLFDEEGWLDASEFLDTAYGFVPMLAPITEPAVGYGAVGALVFIDRHPASEGQHFVRPNITVVGAMATENGTEGAFGAHLGTWLDGQLRTMVAIADMDVNLAFFGLGGDRNPGDNGLAYSIAGRGGVAGGNYRFGDSPWWLGLRYSQVSTRVNFDTPASAISPNDSELLLVALTPSLTFDMRNNFFTPTAGWYVDLSVPVYRESFGGDRDFETLTLLAMHYRPLGSSLFLSARGGARTSSDDTPFFLRPYVWLRGVQVLSYQGEQAAELELELRWQLHSRFSLVGFGGAGMARSAITQQDREETVTAGGGGFRYLVARKYGLHMGLDVAFGPDDPVLYVVFGSAWMRP